MLDAIEWAERSITIELHLLTGISEQVRNDVPGLAALQERPLDRPSRWVQCDLRRAFFLDAGPPFCWAESIRRGLRDLTQLMPVGRMQGCVI